MNVRKKMELSLSFESYWDMLPPEMKMIIVELKEGQEAIDEERKMMMRDLCYEIKKYGELKRKWEIGHIKCIIKKECVLHASLVICISWGVIRMRKKM